MTGDTPIYYQVLKERAAKAALEANKSAFTPPKSEKESK